MTTTTPQRAPRNPDHGKISKRAADYSPGMPQSHCGICRHYQGSGRCAIVAGSVEPSYWCRYFKKR